MDAAIRGANWTRRRAVVMVLTLAAITLLAGGLGGYLVRGVATVIVTHTVYVPAHASTAAPQEYFGVQRTTAGFIPGL